MPVRRVEDVPSEPVAAGEATAIQVLIGDREGPHFSMRRFEMQPGGSMPLHTNTVEHEQYVLSGRADVRIGDEVHRVEPGAVVFIPAGTPHDYQVVGDEPFAFLCLVPNQPDEIRIVEA